MAPKKSAKPVAAKPEEAEDADPDFQVNEEVIQKLMASGNAEIIAAMQKGLMRMVGSSSGYIESLPAPVQTRVAYLEELQAEYDELEEKMHEEIKAIEEKYTKLSEPLLEKRRAVVAGTVEAPENETEDGKKAIKEAGDDLPAGIPDFWAVALRAHPDVDEMIQEKDAEVLAYLTDISGDEIKDEDGDDVGFTLSFTFRENPFFTNKTLTVRYDIEEDGPGGLQVKGITGTDIKWKPDMDVTVKKMKKKPKPGSKAKAATKLEPVDSFFRFFTDVPEMPDEDEAGELEEEELEAIQDAVEHHMGIAEIIRERIVPHAVSWFNGDAVAELYEDEDDDEEYSEYDDDDDEDDDEEEESEDEDDDEEGDGKKKAPKDSGEKPQECKQQ